MKQLLEKFILMQSVWIHTALTNTALHPVSTRMPEVLPFNRSCDVTRCKPPPPPAPPFASWDTLHSVRLQRAADASPDSTTG